MKPKPRSRRTCCTRPRTRTGVAGRTAALASPAGTVALSEAEREDITKGLIAESVSCFPESTVASCNLLLCPMLIARVADGGLAAVVPAPHGQVVDVPARAPRQAAEGAVV